MEELFVPVGTPQEAARVEKLNSPEAAKLKAERLSLVREKGVVNEMDMPNTQADLQREISKRKLAKSVARRIRTTMVGAISACEEKLGRRLWAFGKDQEECTEAELMWRAYWDDCRNRIFDVGNAQIRAVEQEIEGLAL